MRAGDRILLTKGVAVEGTALIAREFPQRLVELGLRRAEVEECQKFLTEPGISILPEAEIAADCKEVRALHDVTEAEWRRPSGSWAPPAGIAFGSIRIAFRCSGRRLGSVGCWISTIGVDWLGSLLIACGPEGCRSLSDALQGAGIPVACIGEVLEEGSGVEALEGKAADQFLGNAFETDEIARLFSE